MSLTATKIPVATDGDSVTDGSLADDGSGNISGFNSIFLDEQAAAEADVAGDGQLWVKSDTPNSLYFTDDAGTDVAIVTAGAVAVTAHKDSHDPEDGSDKLDTAAASEIAGVQAAAAGSSHSFARADHAHQIQHAITDNHLVTVDSADAADNDYAKFTASGLEGRSYAEVMGDLSGTAAADFSMNTHKITSVTDPTLDQDAATKKYVDDNTVGNVVEDTTPQLGGDLEYNEKHQVFNNTMTSDDTASGDIITVTFGENVVFGEVCYPDATDNEWKKALATNAAVTYPGMGIALETKANAETGKLLLRGLIRDDSAFAGAQGDIVYLSDAAAGDVLYAAPSDAGDIVQILGFCPAENYVFFNPSYTYVEVG